jgi:hypothetical protein
VILLTVGILLKFRTKLFSFAFEKFVIKCLSKGQCAVYALFFLQQVVSRGSRVNSKSDFVLQKILVLHASLD